MALQFFPKIAGRQVRNTILGEECTSAIFHTFFFAKKCGIQAPKNSVRRLAVPVQFVLFQYSMSKSGNIILSISRFFSVHSAYQPVILNIPVPKFSESIGLFNHDTHQARGLLPRCNDYIVRHSPRMCCNYFGCRPTCWSPYE